MPASPSLPPAIYRPASIPTAEAKATDVMRRMREEYLEMPGLCLTLAQACRLWSASDRDCRVAFERLVADGILVVSTHGLYVRPTSA